MAVLPVPEGYATVTSLQVAQNPRKMIDFLVAALGATIKGLFAAPVMDAAFKRAVGAGGEALVEPRTEFYGDRCGCVQDPWGNKWWLATHVGDVTEAQLKERFEKMQQQSAQQM